MPHVAQTLPQTRSRLRAPLLSRSLTLVLIYRSPNNEGTASAYRGRVGVEVPVDMIGAPRVRAGPPYHRFCFAADDENKLAAQQCPTQQTRGSTRRGQGRSRRRRVIGDSGDVHPSRRTEKGVCAKQLFAELYTTVEEVL